MPTLAQTLKIGKVFLADVSVEALILLVLEIVILTTVKDETTNRVGTNPTIVYGVLLIVSLVFFLLFAWDAILNENSIQLFTFLFFSVMLTIYSFVRFIRFFGNPLYIAEFAVLVLGNVLLFIIGYQVYTEFGWRIYKKVGADPRTRSMYKDYLILMTLVKLDFSLAIILLAQNVSLALRTDDIEFYLNIFAVIFVVIYTALVVFAVHRESNPIMLVFFALSILEPAYVIFKMVRFTTVKGKGYEEPDFPLWQLLASGAFSLVLRMILLVFAVKAYKNFGKGLIPFLSPGRGDPNSLPSGDGKMDAVAGSNLGSYNGTRTLRMEDS